MRISLRRSFPLPNNNPAGEESKTITRVLTERAGAWPPRSTKLLPLPGGDTFPLVSPRGVAYSHSKNFFCVPFLAVRVSAGIFFWRARVRRELFLPCACGPFLFAVVASLPRFVFMCVFVCICVFVCVRVCLCACVTACVYV